MNVEILYQVILMLAGIGTIIYGIKVMNSGIENSLGFKFKKILAKQNKKYFKNCLLGTGMSFVVQTSTITNIMTTGLINIGTINLSQGIAICLGAGFGSAVAMVLLMFESISIIQIFSLFVFVGALMFVFTKTSKGQLLSKIFLGFGLLCFGITILSSSINSIVSGVDLTSFFTAISNPILFILICLLLTMIMQSGYPVVVILVSLLNNGLISFESACFGIVGMNIGSALVVSLLLTLFDEGNNGKRLIVFNILHKILFSIIIALLMLIPTWLNFLHEEMFGGVASISIVVFNIIVCFIPIVLLPFSSQISKMMKHIIKDKKSEKQDDYSSFEIDEKILNSAVVAYGIIKTNIKRIFNLILDVNKTIYKSLFKDEKITSQKSKIKAIEKAMKLTNNNLVIIAGKMIGKELNKINALIDIMSNLQNLLKANSNLYDLCNKKEVIEKEIDKTTLKFAFKYFSELLDFGERVDKIFDENTPKKEKSDETKILFKANDIMIANRNKSKQKLINNNGFVEGNNVYYFSLLYEMENVQQDYFDIVIKLMLLED